MSQPCNSSIQYTRPHVISVKTYFILLSHLRLDFLQLDFLNEIPQTEVVSISSMRDTYHLISFSSINFISQYVLRQVHSLFQSELSAGYELVLPLSVYSMLSLRSSSSCLRLLLGLPITCTFPSIFPSITCFRR